MNEELLEYKVAQHDKEIELIKSNNKNVEEILTQLRTDMKLLTKTVDVLSENQSLMNKSIKEDIKEFKTEIKFLKEEVKSIKEEPARDYKNIKTGIVATVITTILGFIAYILGIKK